MQWTSTVRTSVLLAALAGPVQAQPAPLPLLDVPFISQSEALCGGAAAAMVLRFWGERGLTAESFAHLVDRSAAGIRTNTLLGELQRRGWTAIALDGSDDAIDAELRKGRPVLTLIEDRPSVFHYIVIVGFTRDAVIFHDPARAPLRVTGRTEFARRWQRAGRWMAVVVPGDRAGTPAAAPEPLPNGTRSDCDALIARGVEQAQAKDLEGAERTLTAALSCGGAAAMRELAGVRALQQRWADVESLSTASTELDPSDAYAWRLLATSRFVQNNHAGALEAWNHVGEPRLDLIRVSGLVRTRQRTVEELLDAQTGVAVSADLLLRSERRLREMPAALSAAVDVAPVPGGLAELRATVNERPILPSDVWSYAAVGISAASQREVGLAIGPLTGGGERVQLDWRFWPGRPRVAVSLDAPAPWGGVWGVGAFSDNEQFTVPEVVSVERVGGSVRWSNWVDARVRWSIEGGIEEWNQPGTVGRARSDIRFLSRGTRVDLRGGAEFWGGAAAFSRADVAVTGLSSRQRTGRIYLARAGAGWGSSDLPAALWFGGDTGATRPTLLRAHPLVDEGRLVTEQLGRHIVNATVEAQQWRRIGLISVGAAAFVDAAHTSGRIADAARSDVDAGGGLRLAFPGVSGVLRVDVATAIGDGGTRWSFVYEPGG